MALPSPWEHVEIGDWTYLGESTDGSMILLMQPGRQRGHVWVRYEHAAPRGEIGSSRRLVELDCEGGRTRIIQDHYFPAANMTGAPIQGGGGGWSYAAPGTFSEVHLAFGCVD